MAAPALRVSSHKLLATITTVTKSSSSCLKPSILSRSISPYLRRCRNYNHLASPLSTLPAPAPTRQYINLRNLRNFHSTAANMGVNNVNSLEDWRKVLDESKQKLVVVDFYATWCGPCKVIAPKVEAFSVDYTDVLFYKVDVDELNQVASEVGVRAMPTFMLFKNGEKVAEVVGANPSALKAAIEKYKA